MEVDATEVDTSNQGSPETITADMEEDFHLGGQGPGLKVIEYRNQETINTTIIIIKVHLSLSCYLALVIYLGISVSDEGLGSLDIYYEHLLHTNSGSIL